MGYVWNEVGRFVTEAFFDPVGWRSKEVGDTSGVVDVKFSCFT